MILFFTVDKQIITRRDSEKVVRDSVNYLHVNFSFSEDWTGDKTAVFKSKSGIAYNVLIDENGSCLVPWEVLKEEYFEVSAFCGDLITANVVKVFTIQSGYEIGSQGRIPTPDIYTQIIARLSAIEDEIDPTAIAEIVDEYISDKGYVTEADVEQIVSDYVEAHKDELKGDTGATGPQGPQGVQGPKGDTGEGVPTGGTTGQVLIKSSDADYDTEWGNIDDIADYPPYMNAEKEEVLTKLKTYYNSKDLIVIGFNTDQHVNSSSEENMISVLSGIKTLRDLTKEFPFTLAVLGGDNVYSNNLISIQNEVDMVRESIEGADCPTVDIIGNHDRFNHTITVNANVVFASHETKSFKDHVYTNQSQTTNCYYDDSVHRIRYIFVCTTNMGPEFLISKSKAFLLSALENLPDEYAAIIFSHHPLGDFPNATSAAGDWHDQKRWGTDLAPYADKIIACICGHSHCDKAEIENGILYICTTCAGWTELNDGSTRTYGSADATAYDVYVVDRNAYTLHVIRFGNGSDRTVAYYVPDFTNALPISIDKEGTIYNSVGYKDHVKFDSNGEDTSVSAAVDSYASGYIRVEPNDTVDTKNCFLSRRTATDDVYLIRNMCFYDTNFTLIRKKAINSWVTYSQEHQGSAEDIQPIANDEYLIGFTVTSGYDGYVRFESDNLTSGVVAINKDIPTK